ncbi:PLD nuclease N-terminal domain-containing protein [Micromonospora sp. NPDC000316]|uniref:PLD nuclease N-terminal domain-containing protein n=1 Tax=Micromonospora sp. NPDC000316 TaxID=3364216 RepID=UPI0036AC596E
MARLYILLFLVQIVLAVCALISCLSAEEGQIRVLPRIVWALIILFFPLVGSIAWFLAGREPKPGAAGLGKIWPAGSAAERQPRRPLAPDDDPEFLRSVQDRAKQQDEELFRRWEEDLRRREDDLRRRDDPPREGDRPEV